jgi:putative phage-type endonuclease
MPDVDRLLTTQEAAEYLRVAVVTLARWRKAGIGPDCVQLERKFLYHESALAAFLAARRLAITATDAGAILGVSPYATPLSVYLEKIGEPLAVEQTERMEMGNWFQRPIINLWAKRERQEVVHGHPFTFLHRDGTHIGATLDAWTVTPGVYPVDAKNIGWRTAEWGAEKSDVIPLHIAAQLVIQMYVLGAPRAYLPVLFGGNELVEYGMERDDAVEAEIVGRCEHFWRDYVEARVLPAVDGGPSWNAYLKRLFKKHTDVVVRATREQDDLAHQLQATLEQFQLAETECERLKNVLKLAIGENRAIEGPRFKATWTLVKDTVGTDWEAVAKAVALEYAQLSGQPATHTIATAAKQHQVVTRQGSRRFTFSFKR